MPLPPDQEESEPAPVWTDFDEELERKPVKEEENQDSEDEVEAVLLRVSLSDHDSSSDDGSHTEQPPLLQKWRAFVDQIFKELPPPTEPDRKVLQFIADYKTFIYKKAGSLPSIVFREKVPKPWANFRMAGNDVKKPILTIAAAESLRTWVEGLWPFCEAERIRQADTARARGGEPPQGRPIVVEGRNISFSQLTMTLVEEELRLKIQRPLDPCHLTPAQIAAALVIKFEHRYKNSWSTASVASGLPTLIRLACEEIVAGSHDVAGRWYELCEPKCLPKKLEEAVTGSLKCWLRVVVGVLAKIGIKGWSLPQLQIANASGRTPVLAPVDPFLALEQPDVTRHTIGTTFTGTPDIVFFSGRRLPGTTMEDEMSFSQDVNDVYSIRQHPLVTARPIFHAFNSATCFFEAKAARNKLGNHVAQAAGQALIGLIKMQLSSDAVAKTNGNSAPLNVLGCGATWVLTKGSVLQFGIVLPLPESHPLRTGRRAYLWQSASLPEVSLSLDVRNPDVDELITALTMLVIWCCCDATTVNRWLSEILAVDGHENSFFTTTHG